MNPLTLIESRFRPALAGLVSDPAKVAELLDMIRPAQDAKFGDYQANFAMPLKKDLGQPPPEIARRIIAATDLTGICASRRKSPARASSTCASATTG